MYENILKPYFEALNIQKKECSLKLVSEIQKKHLATFSFNNLAVLLKGEVSLDLENIVEKIVLEGRGGYCFEHNKLMYEVLKSLGFRVRFIIGKVLLNQDIDVPRTHRVTILEFEGESYLVDVGFGHKTPNKPLQLSSKENQGKYRIFQNEEGEFALAFVLKNTYFTLYKFDLYTYTEADCVMGNFYSSHYKKAAFVNNFVISLIQEDVTLSLRNLQYLKIYKEETQTIKIQSKEELDKILKSDFVISLTKHELDTLYERVSSFTLS